MAKPPSPLVGFNNNVKHHGRIFHVQTEDSGIKRPRIVTHLFADGGRIIKSTRTDYTEHLGRADMQTVIRRMMKEQHKAMFIALRDGQLNETIEKVLGPAGDSPDGLSSPRPSRPPLPGRRRSKPPPTLPTLPPSGRPMAPPPKPVKIVAEAVARRAAPTLTDLVLKDLEAARARSSASEPAAIARPSPPKGTPVLGTPPMPPRPSSSAGRYVAARPAAIFASPKDQSSLFGGSSISEQSLDEVILSYLAEDLDGSVEK